MEAKSEADIDLKSRFLEAQSRHENRGRIRVWKWPNWELFEQN